VGFVIKAVDSCLVNSVLEFLGQFVISYLDLPQLGNVSATVRSHLAKTVISRLLALQSFPCGIFSIPTVTNVMQIFRVPHCSEILTPE